MEQLLEATYIYLVILLVFLLIVISLFLLFRQIFLWYWKINSLEKLSQEQVSLLKQILEVVSTKEVTNISQGKEET